MFGHCKPGGATAETQAVVLKTTWISQNSQRARYLLRVRLRVHFDDGSTSEFSWFYHHTASAGDLLAMRFDPNDHSKVELINQTWKEQSADRARATEQRVARAEGRISSDVPAVPNQTDRGVQPDS
jgi:hypothetical protein